MTHTVDRRSSGWVGGLGTAAVLSLARAFAVLDGVARRRYMRSRSICNVRTI